MECAKQQIIELLESAENERIETEGEHPGYIELQTLLNLIAQKEGYTETEVLISLGQLLADEQVTAGTAVSQINGKTQETCLLSLPE